MTALVILYFLMLCATHIACDESGRPNIVIVVADDVGFDDVSLHGSNQILTTNIDTLAYHGVIIENYYTDCYGTASTSALLTGKYPMKLGTQGPSIRAAEDRGVPVTERLLPSYLKDLGYISHFVGKWPLGKSRRCYLPMNRGFETFYGFTCPVDYYTYHSMETCNGTDYSGLDLHDGFDPVVDQSGHLTNILTERALKKIKEHDTASPLYLHVAHAAAHSGGALVNLQAPEEDVAANSHIVYSPRRRYAALVKGVDESVGKIIETLANQHMLHNTVIIFICDNGASSVGISRNYGSNLPLRGTKGSPWEGAVRTTAILWKADMESPKIWKGLFHVTDWVPTLLAAAGGKAPADIDGINQWNSIVNDEKPQRNQIIVAVDDLNKWGAFRDGDIKIIIGTVPNTCGYYGQELSRLIHAAPDYEKNLISSRTFKVFTEHLNIGLDVSYALEKRNLCNLNKRKSKSDDTELETRKTCVPTYEKGCLYNITADPEESQDLWDEYPEIVQSMIVRFRLLWDGVVPRAQPTFDVRADPANNNYVWLPWLEDDDEQPAVEVQKRECPMKVTIQEIKYIMDINIVAMGKEVAEHLWSTAGVLVDNMRGYPF